jgi:hypothetical protein
MVGTDVTAEVIDLPEKSAEATTTIADAIEEQNKVSEDETSDVEDQIPRRRSR